MERHRDLIEICLINCLLHEFFASRFVIPSHTVLRPTPPVAPHFEKRGQISIGSRRRSCRRNEQAKWNMPLPQVGLRYETLRPDRGNKEAMRFLSILKGIMRHDGISHERIGERGFPTPKWAHARPACLVNTPGGRLHRNPNGLKFIPDATLLCSRPGDGRAHDEGAPPAARPAQRPASGCTSIHRCHVDDAALGRRHCAPCLGGNVRQC